MIKISLQYFGGRGGGGSGGARGGGRAGGGGDQTAAYQKDPENAPVGTRLKMGNYEYTKNARGTWTTFLRSKKSIKKVASRTNADIKRVFT